MPQNLKNCYIGCSTSNIAGEVSLFTEMQQLGYNYKLKTTSLF